MRKLAVRSIWILALALGVSRDAQAVYGGLAADTKQFGFVRFLEITQNNGSVGGCSGTLLERGMILTAAHCVIDNSNRRMKKIVVKLKRSDKSGVEAWGANVHSGYRPGGYLNDIAILYTMIENDGHATLPLDYVWNKVKAQNAKAYYPAFLKQVTVQNLRGIFAKSIPRDPQGHLWAYAVGFGLTCPASACPTLTNTARYVGKRIYAMSGNGCQPGSFDFNTAPQRFCALTEEASITRPSTHDGKSNINFGDSGGPLFSFDQDGTAVVIGIVNAGNGIYEAFTSVYDHLDFLKVSLNGSVKADVREIRFSPDSSDSAEPKVESGAGLKEVIPLVKEMLAKYDHRKSGTRFGGAVQGYWADEVIYAGKRMSRDQLRITLDNFGGRWPQRNIYINKVRRASSCSGNECTVVAEVVALLYRGNEESDVTGLYTWIFRREGSGWRIGSQTFEKMTRNED